MQTMSRTATTRRAAIGIAAAVLALALTSCSSSAPGAASNSTTGPDQPVSAVTQVHVARGSAGCGRAANVTAAATDGPGDVSLTVDVAGHQRTYRLGIPPACDSSKAAPLILALHGNLSDAAHFSPYTGLPRRATARGFITVTPDAVNTTWADEDEMFLLALLDDVTQQYCVDLNRVHMTGFPLGAWKAAVLACRHPGRFASIAMACVELFPSCDPMPAIAFHGQRTRSSPTAKGAIPTSSSAGGWGTFQVPGTTWRNGHKRPGAPKSRRSSGSNRT